MSQRGKNINRRRTEINMSIEELARRMHTSPVIIKGWESGQMALDSLTGKMLARELDIPFGKLWTGVYRRENKRDRIPRKIPERTNHRRALIYAFICDFLTAHKYYPSFRTIQEGVGLASVSTVYHHMKVLELQGKVVIIPETGYYLPNVTIVVEDSA